MKLLPTIVAAAAANNFHLPDGTHDSACLFPNDADSTAVFNDKFSQFSFSTSAVSEESYGDLYAEGTTVSYQLVPFGSSEWSDLTDKICKNYFSSLDDVQQKAHVLSMPMDLLTVITAVHQ